MKKYILIVSVLFFSCSDDLHGKIDYRYNKPACAEYVETTVVTPFSFDTVTVVTAVNTEADKDRSKIDSLNKYLAESSRQAYLINSSKTKSYSFTVKMTPSDSTQGSTEIYKLKPGEEIAIGCDKDVDGFKVISKKFEVVGEESLGRSNQDKE